jgi:hypothetical protein
VLGAHLKMNQQGGWEGWFPIRMGFTAVPGQTSALLSREPSHVDLFLVDSVGTVQSTFRATVQDSYIARASVVGRLLEQTASVLAIQGFIPEVGAGGSDDYRLQVKVSYWKDWLHVGVPVLFDVCPGYDARFVFPGSTAYGNNHMWRSGLKKAWSSAFQGTVFNTWNGYTEGYAAVPTIEHHNANWNWAQEIFTLAKLR